MKLRNKKKGELIIKKKFLKNKSRKGWHYYIREIGKKSAYYKIQKGVELDNYLLAYQGKLKVKKKGVIQYTKESPAQKYLKSVVKAKKLEDLISKGITEREIPNIAKLNKSNIHKAYIEMLRPLVKDKELLNIIALEENVKKFKYRIQTIVSMESEDKLVQVNLRVVNKDLAEIITDFGEIRPGSKFFEKDLKGIIEKGYMLDGMPKGFDITNYGDRMITNNIGNVSIKLKFVKAK